MPVEVSEDSLEQLLRARPGPDREECHKLELIALAEAGVASPEEQAEAVKHLQDCPACAEALLVLSSLHERQLLRPGPLRPLWKHPSLVAAAAGLVLILFTIGLVKVISGPPSDDVAKDQLVVKGARDDLFLAVQRGADRFRLKKGQALKAGDKLGLFYSAPTKGYLAVFNLEQDGDSTLLYPAGESRAAAIVAGTEIPLPDGSEVLEASGCEWVIAVFADQRLEVDKLMKALRRAVSGQKDCRIEPALPGARTVRTLVVRGRP